MRAIRRKSRACVQDEINDLIHEVIAYSRDLYPDKVGVTSLRTYFIKRRDPVTGPYEELSSLHITIGRVRERPNPANYTHRKFKVSVTPDTYEIEEVTPK